MTNYNKLNGLQKNVMGEFMKIHPNLAKNILPNCAQGKATAKRLWEELAKKLNAVGPPVKEAKMWRKVFADQKYQAKKKLSFNKSSKKQTGGGPYVEKIITQAEENIIEASGLEVAVEGLACVNSFGSSSKTVQIEMDGSDQYEGVEALEDIVSLLSEDCEMIENKPPPKKKNAAIDPKLILLEKNLQVSNESKKNMDAKLDKLLEIQERLLQIKEQKFKSYMAGREIELEIKKTRATDPELFIKIIK